MGIKGFRTITLIEAMESGKRELGPGAVILETRVDGQDLSLHPEGGGGCGRLLGRPGTGDRGSGTRGVASNLSPAEGR